MTYPRTMRRGSHALTGIRFDPTPEEIAASEKAAADKAAVDKAAADKAAEEAANSKTFTQAELDRVVGERLARDRKERPSDDEINELREAKKRLDDIEASNATELEKATKRAEEAEQTAAKATATANERLVQAAVLAQATSQKAIRPEHLHKLIDTAAVTVGDDGQVTGAEEAVKAFLDANPEYVGTARASGTLDQGARGGGGDQLMSTEGMTAEEIAEAVRTGKFDAYLKTPK